MAPSLVSLPLAAWEREGLVSALRKAGLPADDVTEPAAMFWRFSTDDDVPAGFGGLEVHGADALMRSVLTMPSLRNRGIGSAIVAALEAEAQINRCQTIWLLTTDAQPYFEKRGYTVHDRSAAPAAIRATAQFSSLCPASAALMAKPLA